MPLPDLAYAAAVLLLAYFVRGISGFGSGLIAVPLLALRFPLPQVVPFMLIADFAASALVGGLHFKRVDWPEIRRLLPATLVGVVLLLIGATSVFGELQDALDRIWRAPKRHKPGVWSLLRARILSFGLIMGRRSLSGSNIGGIAETQEMLDFCGKHGVVCDIELIRMDQINEAYERMLKGDVKYRFVIDMSSLK